MDTPRILIIDDEPALLELLGAALAEQGYDILKADTGCRGLDVYHSAAPDLILIDLLLPDISGFEILKRISAQNEETGLVIISGAGSMDVVIDALRCGAWDFLTKPFSSLELVFHTVRTCLEKTALKRENKVYREHLEHEVARRTQDLEAEIQRRKAVEEELRRSELRYRELSLTDDLTGLYNARHFFKQLQAEVDRSMRHQNPLSLCILDVDHFKRYNDSHGHLCGDAVLAELGRIILHRIRESDSAYRYGGEEFFIILPATCREEAARVAERVRQAFLEHAFFPKDGCEVHVSLSIGVTSFRRGESVSDLVERVDQNLYVAKNAGRNTTVCR